MKKLYLPYALFFVTLFTCNGFAMPGNQTKLNDSRLLISKLRGGDYAHAGDAEAIDLVLQKGLAFLPTLKNETVLDVGSGFGGTADYLYQHGFKKVYGIDIDKAAVLYAKDKYPFIDFKVGDALNIDKLYAFNEFSFLYLFNVIYAIQDKPLLLKKLAAVSKPESLLVVFDYTTGKEPLKQTLKDLEGKPMYPIQMDSFKQDLAKAGWEIIETTDMTAQFITWYKKVLESLATQRLLLKKEFSEKDISNVEKTFTFLVKQLEQGNLGGVIIYARKQSERKA